MSSETRPPVVVRDAVDGDVRFVLATWSRHQRGVCPRVAYGRAAACLDRPGTVVRVACAAVDPDFLIGWAVERGDCLVGVYVRGAYRGIGIARLLVGDVSRFARVAAGRPQCRIMAWRHAPEEAP